MARPTWKGSISFGLVNIPVALYPMEKRVDLSFRLLDSRNHARVRYERVNEVTGEEVPWDKIVKGYEFNDGNYVLLTDKDFERAAVEATKTVEIEDFVNADEIDVAFFDKPYILVPDRNGDKGYVLLREALRESKRVGVAKVVIRTRQYLSVVLPEGDALVLCVLRFANEIRNPKDFDLPREALSKYRISQKEVDMALQLVKSMSSKWKADQYHDEYRDALLEWIEKKAESDGHMPAAEPEEERKPAGKIIDIMDLLKRSVEKSGKKQEPRKTSAKSEKPATRTKAKPKSKARPSAGKKAS